MAVEINYISIRRFADKVKDWISYLLARKIKIGFAFLIGATMGLIAALVTKPSYTGNLTFVLSSETDNSSVGGLMGLASQFGLSFGNKNNAFSGENIIELFRSKKIFQRAIFQSNCQNGQLIINQIANNESFFSKWKKETQLAPLIPFTTTDSSAIGVKDSLINEIYKFALTHYLRIDKIAKELNFYKISITTNDVYVSSCLPIALANETAQFYTEIKQEVAQRNLNMLQREADSLQMVMNKSLATSLTEQQKIFNLNPAMQSVGVKAKVSEVQTRVLQSTYNTVIENIQMAKLTLKKNSPVYQIIDEPETALRAEKTNVYTSIILGAFFITFFYIFISLIQKTLNESKIADTKN